MGKNFALARVFIVLLTIFTIGRWTVSLRGVPYASGSPAFSLVTLTILSSVYYGAFTRRFCGYRLAQAMGLAATLAIMAQLVIVASTAISYVAGLDTYFNNPIALNATEAVPMARAMTARAGGFVVNTILNAIMGAIGYGLGALLPESRA
jgi:hypothetical protein